MTLLPATCHKAEGQYLTDLSFVNACEKADWEIASKLISPESADQSQPDGMTGLHWAAFHGDVAIVSKLVRLMNEIDVRNEYQLTPLAIAALNGHAEVGRELLDAGADPNVRVSGNATPLLLAVRSGNVALVQSLVDQGADVNVRERKQQTALMWAAAEGHADVIDVLVHAGADVNVALPSGFTAMMFAAREGKIEAALRLLGHGVDVKTKMKPKRTGGRSPRDGMSALMLAVESAHYELALKLVEAGADPNDESSGFAPLHAMAWVRRPQNGDDPTGDPRPRGSGAVPALEFVRQIVAAGADVNLQLRRGRADKGRLSPRGATPFLLASQTVDLPLMETLLELGADPMLTNHDECTALLAAAGVGNHHVGEHPGTVAEVERAVRWLVDLGLDINAVDKNGETAMHGAAYRCFPETVKLLESLGADPEIWDHKNVHGWSPLIISKGYRPGSFKPDPPTILAISEAMGDRAKESADENDPDSQRYEP
ncbi:ankyrin repeat domain-containing protein [Rubripirellula amarantea]|uniref:ankyrin repeat domain-containing protein n=1 Tax=Rubripirellula amarantea TaxID=2527999 RepID=UPI001F5EA9F7|nr:ankyrin repeat domain-containing protein [Rubripirellula amarantea]MDA8745683.1 ankyrin repeat domain-containing protein [Rubripirellula amarantea]